MFDSLYEQEADFLQSMHTAMTGRYVLLGIAVALILLGIVTGDFIETWRNGATL